MQELVKALAECGLMVEFSFHSDANYGSSAPHWLARMSSGHSGKGDTPGEAVRDAVRVRIAALREIASSLRKQAEEHEAEAGRLSLYSALEEEHAEDADPRKTGGIGDNPATFEDSIGIWMQHLKKVAADGRLIDMVTTADTDRAEHRSPSGELLGFEPDGVRTVTLRVRYRVGAA